MQTQTNNNDCTAEATAFVRHLRAKRELERVNRRLNEAIYLQEAATVQIDSLLRVIEALREEIAITGAMARPIEIKPVRFFGIDEVTA